jgi:cytochrome P450
MIKDKKVEDRIRQSLATNFETFADKDASLEQFAKEMTLENLEYNKDDYLKYCLYETMRMEAPVPVSSSFMMTENLDIGPYKIRAGD